MGMDDYIVPQNVEAEKALLGAIFLQPETLDRVAAILHPADFYNRNHQRVFQAMLECRAAKQAVDFLTVEDKITGVVSASEIVALTDGVPNALNVDHYVTLVATAATLRSQLKAASSLVNYLEDGGKNPEYALEVARKLAETPKALEPSSEHAAQIANNLLETVEKREQGHQELGLYSSGIAAVDKLVKYERQKLYIIAGRPSMGKTAFALNQALALCEQGLSGLFIEQEMPSSELMTRILSQMSRADFYRIREASPEHPLTVDEWQRIREAEQRFLGQYDLYLSDRPSVSIEDVHREISVINMNRDKDGKGPLDFVVFDYIQIADLRGDTRVNAVGNFTRVFKQIAREKNLIAIALSQLSRPPKDQFDSNGVPPVPQISDLRDSGTIEQDADGVAFIHRPEWYMLAQGKSPGGDAGTALYAQAKNRAGKTDTTKLAWHGNIMSFSDPWWTEQEEANYG